MKDYINQIYNEGMATTFYQRPLKYINMKIKNKIINKIIRVILISVYTIGMIGFAIFLFISKWPL